MRKLTLLVAGLAVACGEPLPAAAVPVAGEEARGPSTSVPAAVASPSELAAPHDATTAEPPSPPAPPEQQPLSDEGPVLDCSTMSGGPPPSRRWLCEMVTGERRAELVDARGFALVTQFELAGDDVDSSEGSKKERVCGAEAEARVRDLLATARYKLAAGDESDPWVSCKGLTCELRGEGEWSTWITLYFRPSPEGPKLEAWTEIELALVPPEIVAQREAFLVKWRAALAKQSCGAP